MAGIIGNGLSALLANQRALQTVSNNIANASTEGYVRQRTNMVEAPTHSSGNITFGQGVQVSGVERLYDRLLTEQFQESSSFTARADAFNGIASRTDRLLGNPETGISVSIQRFFAKMEAVSRDPTSMANRQQLLIEGEALANRFSDLDGELASLGTELEARIRQSVEFVNQTTAQIATLNERIIANGVNPPADLLNQRDVLVRKLGEQIDVRTSLLPDGSLSVFAGSGQSLVLGTNVSRLDVVPDVLDGSRLEVVVVSGGLPQEISGKITGGAIGGLLAARADVLEPARLGLAQLAVGLASAVNEQHRLGLDYNGDLGGDFFQIDPPRVLPKTGNAGTGSLTATLTDPSAAEPRDYEMRYDGTTWTLYDRASHAVVPMTGNGSSGTPFVADGMSIVVSGTHAAGDAFLVRPLRDSVAGLELSFSDPALVAAASPVATAADLDNQSDATIGPASIYNIADPSLLQTATITFTSPTTYTFQIDTFTSPPQAYVSGNDIYIGGRTVQITGTPAVGDVFTVSANPAGSGDNANALAMSRLPQLGYFENGRQSFADLNADLVSTVGAVSARAANDLTAQQSILNQAEMDLESVSGVNLDEEAADLLKYQQAYQAAARIIAVGDELFRSILSMVGR